MTTRRRSRLLPIALLLVALPALAWAPLGHRLVGALAQRQLTPVAAAQVKLLLQGEPEPTLAGVATWADDLRNSDPALFKKTSRWHYSDYPEGSDCQYVPARDCKDGNCVIAAIEAQRAILADRSQPLAARRQALKFVVHLVGDAHQPLHSSDHDDQGGNKYQVSLRTTLKPEAYAKDKYVNGVMGTNLHAMWDYYVLGETGLDLRRYSDRLWDAEPGRPPGTSLSDPAGWAHESCELIDAWGLYPAGHVLDAHYGDTMRPLAEHRVEQAGWRLAQLLNAALDPNYIAPKEG